MRYRGREGKVHPCKEEVQLDCLLFDAHRRIFGALLGIPRNSPPLPQLFWFVSVFFIPRLNSFVCPCSGSLDGAWSILLM
jgi:hypothetical protein